MVPCHTREVAIAELDIIDHPDPDHPARPAATLVLVRDADELELLHFFGGARLGLLAHEVRVGPASRHRLPDPVASPSLDL